MRTSAKRARRNRANDDQAHHAPHQGRVPRHRSDIEPMRFESRPEARDWCKAHYPGYPITEIGRDASRRVLVMAKGEAKEGGVTP